MTHIPDTNNDSHPLIVASCSSSMMPSITSPTPTSCNPSCIVPSVAAEAHLWWETAYPGRPMTMRLLCAGLWRCQGEVGDCGEIFGVGGREKQGSRGGDSCKGADGEGIQAARRAERSTAVDATINKSYFVLLSRINDRLRVLISHPCVVLFSVVLLLGQGHQPWIPRSCQIPHIGLRSKVCHSTCNCSKCRGLRQDFSDGGPQDPCTPSTPAEAGQW